MIKVLTEGCEPTRGTKHSACVDLYAAADAVINVNGTSIVPLGICIDLDLLDFRCNKDILLKDHYIQLEPRSSLRAKGIISGTGIIDMDYKDEIKIILHNFTGEGFRIKKGDRIAQMMIGLHSTDLFGIMTEEERIGGFGSTGE